MRVTLLLSADEAKAANIIASGFLRQGGVKGFETRRLNRAANAVLRKLNAATATPTRTRRRPRR